ncbi:hypothetical protein [Bosea beijingensis]|uniref:hypothetical protein n=1 Tax=Bosea beijingensis TaxID=3068632 RepID=UPI0027418E6D|nr:hypothetical protein [Bosea sp. REN20]
MSKARDRARQFCAKVPPSGFGSRDNSLAFDNMVGPGPLKKGEDGRMKKVFENRQKEGENSNWQRTFCNDFAGECSRFSTNGSYLGNIIPTLKEATLKGPKPYAWVDAGSGVEPDYGDILGFQIGKNMHLGVAVGVKGGRLHKIEAGQGGVNFGQDFIKWTSSTWPSPPNLVGWVNIDLWCYGKAYSSGQTSPEGLWTVWMNKRTARYAYKFGETTVTWRDVFNGQTGSGTWSFEDEGLVIRWKSGTKDVWDLPLDYGGTAGYEQSPGAGRLDIFATKD